MLNKNGKDFKKVWQVSYFTIQMLLFAYTSEESVHQEADGLPFNEIGSMFVHLNVKAQVQPLQDVMDYIKMILIENTEFSLKDWCIYR